jgi:N-acetylglucosaminyl-diphospho-decaprenol L-rhamnosyltransferase
VLTGLGPFDESIFLYAEDLDLGLRAQRAGVETWFWPEASVLHHGARSTTAAFGSEPFARLATSRHEVIQRRLGRRAAAADVAVQTVTFASRIALKRLAGRDFRREREQLRAVGEIVSGKTNRQPRHEDAELRVG